MRTGCDVSEPRGFRRLSACPEGSLACSEEFALFEAFAALPLSGQRLLTMLTAHPPVPYAEISARLGIPVDSIGSPRRRYVGKLRRHPAIAPLIDPGSDAT